MASVEEQLEIIRRGADKILSEKELAEKLKSGRPLRVKLGVDPTAPDIHFGHTVPLNKLRQFQQLGHQVVLIIGDFTATVGDPTGRSATRPPLTREEVLENAKTYIDQAFLVLDKEQTEVVFNGEWFQKMSYPDILKLNAQVTMGQMLQREDFKKRIDEGKEVRLHEIQYPIMQGWDSVVIKSDVEIGGSDQLFNILVGRDLQKAEGMDPQVVLTLPLLEGLDGVKKMSKSLNNYIGLTDTPNDMFGKLMSISDELMARYYLLLLGQELDTSLHPMEAKKQLGIALVDRYHGEGAGQAARDNWDKPDKEAELTILPLSGIPENPTVLTVAAHAFLTCFDLKKSSAELRRLIPGGAVQLNGEKMTDFSAEVSLKEGDVLRLGKKHSVRVG